MAKLGKCIDCGPGSKDQFLTAGRCFKHYWAFRKSVNAKKPKNVAKVLQKKEHSVFFASQLLTAPSRCENCGEPLARTIATLGPRSIIAHIVPKRPVGGCPSVATHPLNKWFGCGDCHTNYDNKGADFAVKMAVFPVILERFNKFKKDIALSEQKNIPQFLLDGKQ